MAKRQDSPPAARRTTRAAKQAWKPARGGRTLVGMVHLGALPGTPGAGRSVPEIAREAALEAAVLARSGFDAVLVENMHDAPYVTGPHGPEIVSAVTAAVLAVQEALEGFRRGGRALPVGIQILATGNREALAVALATGASFIRAENFVFAHVADEGLMNTAEAGPLLRYRRLIGAEHVAIWADIKKKHAAHALTADLSLGEACEGAEFFGADGVIVTGRATGKAADPDEVAEARAATDLPVIVGSGVTAETAAGLLEVADALIVGSSIKRGGDWRGAVDERRARGVVEAARA